MREGVTVGRCGAWLRVRRRQWQRRREVPALAPDYDSRRCPARCPQSLCGAPCVGVGCLYSYPGAHMCAGLHQWGERTRRPAG